MSVFRVRGGKKIHGTVKVHGSKNAATPILAASLLTKEPCLISNVPEIKDVESMLDIIRSFGVKVERQGENKVLLEAKEVHPELNEDTRVRMRRMRSSVLFFGPLLARFHELRLPYPGGCEIGSRSIGAHLSVFSDLGYVINEAEKWIDIKKGEDTRAAEVVLPEFSVTATENALMALARTPEDTALHIAAAEPHVQDLCRFLQGLGVRISGVGSHSLLVRGKENLTGTEHAVVGDYIEAGTFIIAALALGEGMTITGANPDHLHLTIKLLRQSGANIAIENGAINVMPSPNLVLSRVQTLPHPGVPTDLQAFFTVLATQTPGPTLIHDPLYEGRLGIIEELKKMGAKAEILDQHRAIVHGPTRLHGTVVQGKDLRGAAALLIAGLLAEGETIVEGGEHLERGYEKMDEYMRSLGADVEKIEQS